MNTRDWVDWFIVGTSLLSSLGILVTIVVYFLQKNNSIASENNRIKRDEEIEKNRLDRKKDSLLRVFRIELKLTIKIYKELNRLSDVVQTQDYDIVKIKIDNEHSTFSFIKNKTLVGNVFIQKISQHRIKELALKSTDIDQKIYSDLVHTLESMEKYHLFLSDIYQLCNIYIIPNSYDDNSIQLSKELFDLLVLSNDGDKISHMQDFAEEFIILSTMDVSYSYKKN